MISWVHTRAKSRLSWQNYVQEVVYKKVDVKNATPDVAERPSKQARPRFQSLRWKNNALWSQRSNLSERLPSIDEDISPGAVVFGNPEKKARPWVLLDIGYRYPKTYQYLGYTVFRWGGQTA